MFTISKTEHSVSSVHSLTEEECFEMSLKLTKSLTNNPPTYIDNKGEKMVMIGSKPYYLCVPTSLK